MYVEYYVELYRFKINSAGGRYVEYVETKIHVWEEESILSPTEEKIISSLPIISVVPTCFSRNIPGKRVHTIDTVKVLLVVSEDPECLL